MKPSHKKFLRWLRSKHPTAYVNVELARSPFYRDGRTIRALENAGLIEVSFVGDDRMCRLTDAGRVACRGDA